MPPDTPGSRRTIGIDARLYQGDFTGIGVYTRNLIDHLALADRENEYLLFTDRPAKAPGPNFRVITIPVTTRIAWSQAALPWRARRLGLDLFHATANHELPLLLGCPAVVTVHDLIPLIQPETTTSRHRLLFGFFIRPALSKAAAVITPSAFVKQSLMERFGLPGEKITPIPEACDPSFAGDAPPELRERVRRRYSLRENYVLYVGALEPRKNLPALIAAFREVATGPDLGEWQLVLAGGGGWRKEEILRAAEAAGLGDRLVVTGFVPPEELPCLYRMAGLFVLPSLYEGFGLPVIEAMACGVPVLVSAPSAMVELAGEAGMTFSLDDGEDLKRKLALLLGDQGLRQRLGRAGADRAPLYSWRRAAQETLAVYRRVLDGFSGSGREQRP